MAAGVNVNVDENERMREGVRERRRVGKKESMRGNVGQKKVTSWWQSVLINSRKSRHSTFDVCCVFVSTTGL